METNLTLRCRGKIVNILDKSTSPAFDKAEIGDILEFKTPIKYPGQSETRCYTRTGATYLTITNTRTHNISKLSFKFCS